MLRKILVPLDGTPFADCMLPQVERLLVRRDAEVVLLTAFRHPPNHGQERWKAELDATRERLRDQVLQLRERGVRASQQVVLGDPVQQILNAVWAYEPEVVAMATRGRGAIGRLVHGTVTEAVLRGCPVPLYICNRTVFDRAPERDRPFTRILVPHDGSELSDEVLPVAAAFGARFRAELILLRVENFSSPEPHDRLRAEPELRASLADQRARLEQSGCRDVRVLTALGVEAGTILEVAEQEQVDLIAMSTHGRSGLARLMSGSVAEEVMRRSPVPVLVRRASALPELRGPRHPVGSARGAV